MSSHPAVSHPAVSVRTYVTIYASLLLLTLLTVTIPHLAQLGAWEVPVALGIATVKTTLVGLFFMHLIHSSRLTWLIIFAGLLLLGVMLLLTLSDYWTRAWVPTGSPM